MNRPLPFIPASPAALQQQLRTEHDAKKRHRLQALYLLASGQASSRLVLAELMAVPRHTIRAWLRLYEQGGLPALFTLPTAPGKASTLPPQVRTKLQLRLADPQGFASYGEIQHYLAREHQVHLSSSAVHALIRYQLQAKPQAPRRSHPKKSPQRSCTSSRPAARSS
jgi:transposase